MLAGAGDDLDLAARHREAVGLVVSSKLNRGLSRGTRPQCLEEHLAVHFVMVIVVLCWSGTEDIQSLGYSPES